MLTYKEVMIFGLLFRRTRAPRWARAAAGAALSMGVALSCASAQAVKTSATPTLSPGLTVDQIVQRLVERNAARAEQLQHYSCKRHYHLDYHGFPSSREASMDVDVTFNAPAAKTFTVTSESGSKMLADRVFRRLMESEKEAALAPARTALTRENYSFELVGTDTYAGRTSYILMVTPRGESRFLYKGKIWVDGKDFAVTRIDAEPAKNPSFWIKKTDIHHQYMKVGEFWLPEHNQTETHTRLGGLADLTIDYSDYQLGTATASSTPSAPRP